MVIDGFYNFLQIDGFSKLYRNVVYNFITMVYNYAYPNYRWLSPDGLWDITQYGYPTDSYITGI